MNSITGLRFIERDGKKILQQQTQRHYGDGSIKPYWEDVPMIKESGVE